MLIGMVMMLFTWLLVLVVCCGIGFSILKLFGLPDLDDELVFSGFWLGWSAVLVMLQILHLAMPVNQAVATVVALIGLAGFAWNSRSILRFLKARSSGKWLIGAAICVFAIWLANRGRGPLNGYDAGLYHISAVRWASSYAIVPGLGNLHGRLAFNSSYFLYQALLDVGPWKHMSHHLAGGILIIIACSQMGLGLYRFMKRTSRCNFCDILSIMFLIPMVPRFFTQTSNTTPDLPVFILGFVVGLQLCRALFEHETFQELVFDVVLITALSAIGVSIKLSFAMLGSVSVLIAVGRLVARHGRQLVHRSNRIRLTWIVVPPILVLVPWMIRGVITSGYLAYPSEIGSFDVEWRVPGEQVILEAKAVRSWARLPVSSIPFDEVLADWDWLIPWTKRVVADYRFRMDLAFPLLLAIAGSILLALRRRRKKGGLGTLWLLLAPSAASLAFWFIAAPEIRFVGAGGWLLGGSVVAWSLTRARMPEFSRCRVVFGSLVLALVVAIGCIESIRYPLDPGFYPIREIETYEFTTNSGLILQVPREGDECWDAPLPCTPYPKPELQLRRASELGSGFVFAP